MTKENIMKKNEREKTLASFEPFGVNFVKKIIETHTMNTKVEKVLFDSSTFKIDIFLLNETNKKELLDIKYKYFPAGWEVNFITNKC
jgi:hypothetical protein